MVSEPHPQTPFHDLDSYVDLPRGAGLALSPDGARLVTGVQTLDPKRTKYVTALWEVDPSGERPARRLTRSAKGEAGAAFLPDGSLLFVSARPDPTAAEGDDDEALLWLLPALASAVCISMSGFSPAETLRNTLRIRVSPKISEVLLCSPDRRVTSSGPSPRLRQNAVV